jgi:chaperonin cofactor prefoldin
MSKEQRVSKGTANLAIQGLQKKREETEAELVTLEKELQAPEARAVQEKLGRKQALVTQIKEIDAGIKEIKWAQENPVKTGACAG